MSRATTRPHVAWLSAGIATLAMFLPLLWAAFAHQRMGAAYAASVQEDGALEWITAWGFIAAGAAFLFAARSDRRECHWVPWFSIGLAIFCFLVALEEISWGQRMLGYRPPVYFLEHNYQLELNVHNLVDTSLRKLTLKAVIIGYGVALPLLSLWLPIRRLLERLQVWAPPVTLVPGFAAAAVIYEVYPWKYSGELVELMLAFGFLFAALSRTRGGEPARSAGASRLPGPVALVAAILLIALVGTANGALSSRARRAHPGNVDAAHSEVEALKQDLLALTAKRGGDPASNCGLHRRVYTWVTRKDVDWLFDGRFAGLTQQGLPEERADYFLDPWNSPYWVRHRCSDDRERVTIYSFGPNRRRDSEPWQLLGDDIGAEIDIEPIEQ